VSAAAPAVTPEPRPTLATHDAGGSTWSVSVALATRSLQRIVRVPAAIVPVLVMPIFFIIAFGGAFSSLVDIPGFPTDNALNWFLPWAILQGAAFAGVGAAFTVGSDLEGGFMDRLLLAPMGRLTLITGPCLAAMARCVLPMLLVTPIAFAGGARLTDGPIGFLTLFAIFVQPKEPLAHLLKDSLMRAFRELQQFFNQSQSGVQRLWKILGDLAAALRGIPVKTTRLVLLPAAAGAWVVSSYGRHARILAEPVESLHGD